jgi:RNAse (barnase) inhibitor barstar
MDYIRIAAPDTVIKIGNNKKVIHVEGQELTELEAFYKFMVQELEFPEYFDDNLDALYDMLTDLQWLSQNCFEIVIRDFGELLSAEDFETKASVISVLNEAAQCWREEIIEEDEWDQKKMCVWILGDEAQLKSEIAQMDDILNDFEDDGEEE